MKNHLASVLEGNLDAYEHLVREHQQSVWSIASLLLYGREETERLVAAIFVQAYRQLDRYDPAYDFGAFVKTIARQVVRERLAAAPADAPLAAYRQHLGKLLADDAKAVIHQRRLSDRVDRCIRRLPENTRTLIDLRFGQGRDLQAISARVNRPIASLRQQVGRARLTLAKCITQTAGTGGTSA